MGVDWATSAIGTASTAEKIKFFVKDNDFSSRNAGGGSPRNPPNEKGVRREGARGTGKKKRHADPADHAPGVPP